MYLKYMCAPRARGVGLDSDRAAVASSPCIYVRGKGSRFIGARNGMAQLQPLFACRECALVQDVRRSSKTGVRLSRNALRQTIHNEGTYNILYQRARDSYCTSVWTLSPLKVHAHMPR